jgi:hypothetical protein
MTDVAILPPNPSKRVYHFDVPFHIPGLWIGAAIAKYKQLGIWERLPEYVRRKARAAKGTWSGLRITRKDLDAIPDHDWEIIARRLKLKWEIR